MASSSDKKDKSFIAQALSDETGWGSFSRLALTLLLPFLVGVIAVDVRSPVEVPTKVYEVLVTVIIALIASSARYELKATLEGIGNAIGAWRKDK